MLQDLTIRSARDATRALKLPLEKVEGRKERNEERDIRTMLEEIPRRQQEISDQQISLCNQTRLLYQSCTILHPDVRRRYGLRKRPQSVFNVVLERWIIHTLASRWKAIVIIRMNELS